jgi:xanthine dehydrogenase accessory factor
VASPAAVRARADELRAKRVPFVLATVVRAERPTSAKPGDAAVVVADGTMTGFIGGDCARSSVQVRAIEALTTGEPVLLRIAPDESAATKWGPAQSGAVTVFNPCLSGGTMEIFLEPALPPPLLVVHGDAPIAHAVADLGQRLGYALARSSAPAAGQVPGDATAVVVASHGRDEADILLAAVRAGVPYIGLVASPRRGAAVLAGLGLTESEVATISTPAGLDIGARTPEEVALSILAEIVSKRPRRPAGSAGSARDAGHLDADVTATAIDPVCGMAVLAVDASPHLDRGRDRYWFCGSGCHQAFEATPETFLGR